MKNLMQTLMFSCKKASELIDKKSIAKLSWQENMRLNLHTSICDGCKSYQKQSAYLDEILHHHIRYTEDQETPQIVNNALKLRIISKLRTD